MMEEPWSPSHVMKSDLRSSSGKATPLRSNRQADSRLLNHSIANAPSRLLNAILMQDQAFGRTGLRQLELQSSGNATVRPSRGRLRMNFLCGLIGNPNHQMPVL